MTDPQITAPRLARGSSPVVGSGALPHQLVLAEPDAEVRRALTQRLRRLGFLVAARDSYADAQELAERTGAEIVGRVEFAEQAGGPGRWIPADAIAADDVRLYHALVNATPR